MPRLVDFLQMHQRVEEPIVLLARQLRNQLESLRCNESALCDVLLSLGHCGDNMCNRRHQLLPYDRLLPPQMPTHGDVKLQLVRVYSPTHYCVRLLEHLLPDGTWKHLPRQPALEMKLQLLQSQNACRHWPPKAKEICTYRNEYGYERVRILHVAHIERMNLSRTDVLVELQALDVDTRLIKTVSGKLYECPEELRNIPPLAIDLRILGMVPFTGERCWHEEDGQQCADWLNGVPQPNFLQASIAMSLSHTIFVHNVGVTSYAPSLRMHVQNLNMCQQLVRKQMAKKSVQAVDKLMEFLVDTQEEKQEPIVDHVVERELEEQQPEEQKQITKQIEVKALSGRLSFFAKMALQLGKENRLRLEEQQHQQLQYVLKEKIRISI